jgi:hypothetical protein
MRSPRRRSNSLSGGSGGGGRSHKLTHPSGGMTGDVPAEASGGRWPAGLEFPTG